MIKNKSPTIRQLQLFSALVESNSISRVAERLHISQPSVSIQLKKLSELLNTELYVLNGRKIMITEAGKSVYQATQGIASTLENLNMELNAFNGLQAGTLRIAVVSTAEYFMPKILTPFCRMYPNIDIELTINNRQVVLQRLKENRDDFYLLSNTPEDLDIVKIPFCDNSLIVMANEKHELTRQPHISLNRLQHYPFILRELGSGTRRSIDLFCLNHKIKLIERMTIESNEAIKHFVAEGLGLGILSRHTLEHSSLPGLVKLDVDKFPIISQWYLVRKNERKLSLLGKTFEDFVQKNAPNIINKNK